MTSPPNAITSAAAASESAMMPFEKTRRCPRVVNCRGRKSSPAWKLAKRGEVGERGVRREHEHHRGGDLQDVEQRRDRAWCSRTPSRPISARTVCCWVGSGTACTFCARNEMPTNIVPSSAPIHISVVRAFFHSGGRNAGTPFEMASTPVIAVLPDASACSPRNSPTIGQRLDAVGGVFQAHPAGVARRSPRAPAFPIASFTIPSHDQRCRSW